MPRFPAYATIAIYQAVPALGGQPHAATERSPQRSTLPADPGTDERAGSRSARYRSANDRPPRPGIRPPHAGHPRTAEAGLPDCEPGRHLHRLGNRSLGGRAGQHALSGRPRADVRDRTFRDAVAQDRRQARPGRRFRARRLAQRCRSGDRRDAAAGRQGACDQGGARRAQRDVDRRDQPHCRDQAGNRPRGPPGAVHGRYRFRARARSIIDTRHGVSMSASPVRRRG